MYGGLSGHPAIRIGQAKSAAIIQAPQAISPTPRARLSRAPPGRIFSATAMPVRAAIHTRFITPRTNSRLISVLDPDRRELWCGDDAIHVEPQVFDLLLHLIRNPDRVVSKDELLSAVWQGKVISESTLSNRINAARRAIGDNGKSQRFIRTVARKGFRFIGKAEQKLDDPLSHESAWDRYMQEVCAFLDPAAASPLQTSVSV